MCRLDEGFAVRLLSLHQQARTRQATHHFLGAGVLGGVGIVELRVAHAATREVAALGDHHAQHHATQRQAVRGVERVVLGLGARTQGAHHAA